MPRYDEHFSLDPVPVQTTETLVAYRQNGERIHIPNGEELLVLGYWADSFYQVLDDGTDLYIDCLELDQNSQPILTVKV